MGGYYEKTDYKTISYAVIRVALGGYLLFHSIIGIIDFDQFMVTALSYFEEGSSISFLAYLTPIVPFMEFFLALMILTGLYTRLALQWAIGVGIFFMLFFHFTDDLTSALEHAYGVIVKISLLSLLFLNKYSLDYYNLWNVSKETKTI
ncbi:DoxX family protein [Nonlabens marinus]|uniref:DoxX family protein n=1 Tax=Nonlabens marinus S1-08 TaxID=1454201 RepID=W8VXG7_9FLAO|nr:hypothetical protein [Nonlabens marinus]BAO55897.1 hypothetical protein NMS_1888 [Nonlabens marinus S1-08]